MMMKRKLSQIAVLLALGLTFYQPITLRLAEAQDEDQGRDIEAIEVTGGRRRGKNPQLGGSYRYRVRQPVVPNRTVQARNKQSRTGQTSRIQQSATKASTQQFPVGPPPKGQTYITLGITLWRIRPATEAEIKDPKVSTEEMAWDGQEHRVVVTRMSDESPITEKDLIQMTVEYLPDRTGADAMPSNQAGYLYVINREQFGNDLKNARLIFPTLLTYDGDNRLLTGKTVTLPGPKRPFRIKRGDDHRQAQAYETYTIILSPVLLDSELPEDLGRTAMALSPGLLKRWEERWNVSEAKADLLGRSGQARTQRELEASGDIDDVRSTEDTAKDLTQDDPPPQTVFRKVVKPGETMLVTIRLPFKATATKP